MLEEALNERQEALKGLREGASNKQKLQEDIKKLKVSLESAERPKVKAEVEAEDESKPKRGRPKGAKNKEEKLPAPPPVPNFPDR